MTYLTGFFLVFAGMLIGYFLWYRDRSEEERQFALLEHEAAELRNGLALSQQSRLEFEERLVRQKGQMSVLQQLCEDWSQSREQSERDRAMLAIEVEDKRRKHDDATSEIQRLKSRQIELEEQVHLQMQENLQQANQIEQSWQKKYLSVESSLNQRKNELELVKKENERLAKLLHQSESKQAELRSEIATNRNLLETATKNVSGLKQEYVSLETSLKENHDLLKRSRGETAAAVSERQLAEQSLTELREQHQALKLEADGLRQHLRGQQASDQERSSLRQSLADAQSQIELLGRQRNEALKNEDSVRTVGEGLQTRLSNQESTIQRLRDQHRDALEKLKYEIQLRSELETAYEERCRSLEDRFQAQQRNAEYHAKESRSELLQEVDRIKLQRDRQSQELTNANQRRDAAVAEQNRLKSELEQTKTEVLKQRKTLEKQTCESADLTNLRRDHEAQMSSLRQRLKTGEETIRKLRRERAAVMARLANYRKISDSDSMILSFNEALEARKRAAYDSEYGGTTQKDPVRGLVYVEEPEFRDDLKLISGVAEVLEARLNDHGIYTFKQIMEWTPEAVEEFGRLLRFKERIYRENWQGQARKLYQDKLRGKSDRPAA